MRNKKIASYRFIYLYLNSINSLDQRDSCRVNLNVIIHICFLRFVLPTLWSSQMQLSVINQQFILAHIAQVHASVHKTATSAAWSQSSSSLTIRAELPDGWEVLLWSDWGSGSGHVIVLLVEIMFPAIIVGGTTRQVIMLGRDLSLTHHGSLWMMCLLEINGTCNIYGLHYFTAAMFSLHPQSQQGPQYRGARYGYDSCGLLKALFFKHFSTKTSLSKKFWTALCLGI